MRSQRLDAEGSRSDRDGKSHVGLARSRRGLRRRATQPLHSQLVEEPAQSPDLSPASLSVRFKGVVVLLPSDPAGQHVVGRDRLGLNPQVRRRRVGFDRPRATGDTGA